MQTPVNYPFRILALDVDGTLIGESKLLEPSIVTAIRKAESQGVIVVIATGRRLQTSMDVINPLGAGSYLIQSSGAVIRSISNQSILHEKFIPKTVAEELVQLVRKFQGTAVWYDTPNRSGKLFVFGKIERNRPLEIYSQPNPTAFVEATSFTGLENAMEIVVFGDTQQLRQLRSAIASRFKNTLKVISWNSPKYSGLVLEVLHSNVSKGSSLEWLATSLDIPRESVAAIGDAENDVEMIAWAGLGVGISSGVPKLRQVSDILIPPPERLGVANYLESLTR